MSEADSNKTSLSSSNFESSKSVPFDASAGLGVRDRFSFFSFAIKRSCLRRSLLFRVLRALSFSSLLFPISAMTDPNLCNGTRLQIKSLRNNIIEAIILNGPGAGEVAFISPYPNDTFRFAI